MRNPEQTVNIFTAREVGRAGICFPKENQSNRLPARDVSSPPPRHPPPAFLAISLSCTCFPSETEKAQLHELKDIANPTQ